MTMQTSVSTTATMRLPNSMRPWIPISGVTTREPGVHSGKLGQPRPEPVSRTAAPESTLTSCTATLIQAKTRIGLVTVNAAGAPPRGGAAASLVFEGPWGSFPYLS